MSFICLKVDLILWQLDIQVKFVYSHAVYTYTHCGKTYVFLFGLFVHFSTLYRCPSPFPFSLSSILRHVFVKFAVHFGIAANIVNAVSGALPLTLQTHAYTHTHTCAHIESSLLFAQIVPMLVIAYMTMTLNFCFCIRPVFVYSWQPAASSSWWR